MTYEDEWTLEASDGFIKDTLRAYAVLTHYVDPKERDKADPPLNTVELKLLDEMKREQEESGRTLVWEIPFS